MRLSGCYILKSQQINYKINKMLPTLQVRHFHMTISRLVRGVGRRSNPGIGHTISNIDDIDADILNDPEQLENIESDFMGAHHTHREYEQEIIQERARVRQHMIKHKYFREPKLPNLLTYAEKEQIRALHARDPEEWSVDRLAESFPATPAIITKILSAKWQARTTERIRQHDEGVIKNWEKFQTDPKALQLPAALQAHLQKFATRRSEDLRALAAVVPPRPQLPRPKTTKFLSIITSCEKYAKDNRKQEDAPQLAAGGDIADAPNPPPEAAENETYLLEKVKDRRRMRLQELKMLKLSPEDLATSNANNSTKEESQKAAVSQSLEHHAAAVTQNPIDTGIISASNNALAGINLPEKYETNEIVISVEDQKRFEITRVKDHVHIPRKLYRKGATYRVEDAYYDSDGELLYRVPGMRGT